MAPALPSMSSQERSSATTVDRAIYIPKFNERISAKALLWPQARAQVGRSTRVPRLGRERPGLAPRPLVSRLPVGRRREPLDHSAA